MSKWLGEEINGEQDNEREEVNELRNQGVKRNICVDIKTTKNYDREVLESDGESLRNKRKLLKG